mmetsp:Transcript_112955/g.243320  ORF Transcript_112955/g.243320 Transcript_112955/m.243320 type:complete len:110 (+) Transcript_112955:648-977(+)
MIAKNCKQLNPRIILHTDAAQSFCKTQIDFSSSSIDLMTLVGHKIGCPKGIGCLVVRENVKNRMDPITFGGGQEMGLRSGTENTGMIVGMGAVVKWYKNHFEEYITNMK